MNIWAMYISIVIITSVIIAILSNRIDNLKSDLKSASISWEYTQDMVNKVNNKVIGNEILIDELMTKAKIEAIANKNTILANDIYDYFVRVEKNKPIMKETIIHHLKDMLEEEE